MPQRLITLVTSALLIGGLFVGAPGPVLAVADSMNVYIGFNSSTSGGSCADPDYTVDGSDDSTAIDGAANDTAAGGTLHFCPGTYDVNATIVLTGKDITLSGASATTTILDGRATWTSGAYVSGGVQIVYSTDDVAIHNLTFRHGFASSDGGAINADTVIATSSTFTNNSANYGGAISGYDSATVTNSTFMKNSAESSGGAVITYNGIIARSRFTRNTAGEHGGAVALWDQNSDDLQQVRGNRFSGNTASGGGAITLRSCETTYTRSQVRSVERVNRFSGNRATQQRRTNNIELWVDDCL